jgi:hypothetical protein
MSAGKGDSPRPTNLKVFGEKWDKIKWNSTNKKNTETKQKSK